jgi:predicted kinase
MDAVSSEETARIAGDSTLTTNLASEVSRATAAEGVISSNLSAEVIRATGVEGVLGGRIDSEISRATGAEGVLTTDLANEVQDRMDAVSSEETARIAGDSTLTMGLASEVSRATLAENQIKSDLIAEESRATLAENQIKSDLIAEESRATAAEVVLQTNINTEKGRIDAILDGSTVNLDQFSEIVAFVNGIDLTNDSDLLTAVTNINTSITAEVTRAEGAEGMLDGKISTEKSRAEAAELVLTNNLSSEVSRAMLAEGALSNRINSEEEARIAADGLLDGRISNILSNTDLTATDSFSEVVSKVNNGLSSVNGNADLFVKANRPSMIGFADSPDGIKTQFDASVEFGTEIVFLNGLMQLAGVGLDYEVISKPSGLSITWFRSPSLSDKINIYGVPSGTSIGSVPTIG